MSLTTNTEIYTKSIERYKENKTEFIQCTLVDFGKNYAEIDEIEFYDEEFKPISDMLLIPFSKYIEQDDYEEEDDDDNDEFEDISLLNKIINEKIYDADREFKEAFEALMQSDDIYKYNMLIELLTPYRVTKELMQKAAPDAIFLHCLPSFHDTNTRVGKEICDKFGVTEMEVTDEVFESQQSKVMDEAENRLHTIKAIMYATMKEE